MVVNCGMLVGQLSAGRSLSGFSLSPKEREASARNMSRLGEEGRITDGTSKARSRPVPHGLPRLQLKLCQVVRVKLSAQVRQADESDTSVGLEL